MNRGKVVSGFVALGIYLGLIFLVLYFYNIHETKAQKFAENPSDRVTVTLVNSDKTVFNKSSKTSNNIKPIPLAPMLIKKPHTPPKKHVIKKVPPKKHVLKKVPPKKHVIKKVPPKKHVIKKVPPKKHVIKKVPPKKHVIKKVPPKKHVIKKVPPKKHVIKKVPPKKSAKDLFSNIKTRDVKHPVRREPKHPVRQPVVSRPQSHVKHNSSISDRIKSTHQSGRVSNANRDSGIKNAYIAKVKRHLNNWNAGSAHKGKRVSLSLTIYNSGKFSYQILGGGDSNMRSSLSQFLKQLNRMGLGRHSKSSPYSIKVTFTAR